MSRTKLSRLCDKIVGSIEDLISVGNNCRHLFLNYDMKYHIYSPER
jgi:hypothetical protein